MTVKPPENSTISVVVDGRDQIVTIPYPKPPMFNYVAGLFVLCWLAGWAFGEIFAAYQLVTKPLGGATAFLAFWLCAWTVGGFFAMLTVRRIFQRSVPEVMRLDATGLAYDPGVPPFKMPIYRSAATWTSLFPKRTELRLDRMQLRSLRLREGDTGNRLTVDAGAQRVPLAVAATDVEREWLFKLLSDRYLPAVPQ